MEYVGCRTQWLYDFAGGTHWIFSETGDSQAVYTGNFWRHFSLCDRHGHTSCRRDAESDTGAGQHDCGHTGRDGAAYRRPYAAVRGISEKRLRAGNESDFVKGFVTLSSMQVIGAMAILGPVQAALGNNELLYFKSVLDFTSAFIFATIYGLGIVPVGLVVLVYQGLFYVLATLFLPLMTTDVIRELNAVGGVMILGIALNMFGTTKLKIADFLPALFIPMIYYHFIC